MATQRGAAERPDSVGDEPRLSARPSGSLADAAVAVLLEREWGLDALAVTPHHAGMNSRTWVVHARGVVRWVAKAVPLESASRLASALTLAGHVEASGIPAGAPRPTPDGRLVVPADGHAVALLRFVDGPPLSGDDPREQRLIGETLARAHRALGGFAVPDAETFHWIEPAAPHLGIRDWLRPAIADALAAYERIPPAGLTRGLLHADPAPEAFLFDGLTGGCGLIDWGAALEGPLMYDVASAVMYVGGPQHAGPLIDAYLSGEALDRAEVDPALELMLRFRWAVQADYFARRIAADDLTGIAGPDDNEKGLEDARRALAT